VLFVAADLSIAVAPELALRRRTAHRAFGSAALLCGALSAYQGWHLHQSNRINESIAGASISSSDASAPEAQFARAAALARAGKSESALKLYKALIQNSSGDLRRASRYNLGNLYMRDALKNGPDEAFKSLPLIEPAKQSYRDLLRENPDDWDARYNLERALWLSPEVEPPVVEDNDPPDKEENVATTLQHAKIDLP
jgi:mxaK protein